MYAIRSYYDEVYLKNGIGIGTALSTNRLHTDKINTKLYCKNWAHLEILHNRLTTNPKTMTVQAAKKAFVFPRITSYNVCYTKLLRTISYAFFPPKLTVFLAE